ncbi:WbqC family protein [Candidatus Nitrotoga arctica]|uniref:WbqC-like protein family protein n=1 Tax=Candidatus Nitrotoga arctica TaxID=453162 RepID=A0ABM8Z159_9PROT|nr:WbqC family protein [Candidatus Nitrotoga arctica]CAG9933562.1 WbqC-like protein family protein [Candidatus Nitrotoga arctica]
MKLSIMQPYFFPYIGYWQLMHAVDRFVIYDDVNYIKGGWINRNRILINGEPTFITAPLYQSSSYKRMCDISLQSSPVWRDKLVRKIEITYRRAPYYAEVFPVIEKLILYNTDSLSDYLAHQLQALAAFIGINTEFIVTSRCYENNGLPSQARILDICAQEGATTYINPQGGQALYDRATFAQSGLDLKFLTPSTIEYKQFGPMHVPWLSIIDVMMFNSPSQLRTLLNKYELV